MLKTALHFSRQLLAEVLQPGDIAVDATMGNGHDTLFMAECVGKTGLVYAFDIQAQAIEATKARLTDTPFEQRVQLIIHPYYHQVQLQPYQQNQLHKQAVLPIATLQPQV